MTESVGEAFALLEGFGPNPPGNQLKTRVLGLGRDVDFRVGLDPHGGRHFLIPLQSGEELLDDRRGRNLVLVSRTLTDDNDSVMRFADIACLDPELSAVFEQLLEDLSARIGETSEPPLRVATEVIADWKELFSGARSGLTAEEERGLLAELLVLESLARIDPARAIAGWSGPDGASWDFRNGSNGLEVKATISVDPNSVRVSNIEQLDPSGLDELVLAVVHLRDDPEGTTISKMVDRLNGRGVDRRRLIEKLETVGYLPGTSGERGYSQASLRCWIVDAGFPSLRRSDISSAKVMAISKIQYDLSLPVAGLMESEDEIFRCFGRWFQR